jgi:glycosyltransferase involved in cell wall biosynthesis
MARRRAIKVLIVSYYFPPAGGGGVQRPLKFAANLAELGIEPHVLAPDDPHWIHSDPRLEVPPDVRVHRAPYIGPRGRLPAEELYGLTGTDRLLRRLALTPRRLLIPDENVTWALTAARRGLDVIRREKIDAVLTTSPPSSIHLLGLLLKRRAGIPWVADLRDSLGAKNDRRFESRLVRLKERSDGYVASLVARHADAVVGVTPTISAEIEELGASRVVTIPNGCDFEDFEGLGYERGDRFRITHTGSFFGARSPRRFLTAQARSGLDVVARFVGDFRGADRDWAEDLGLGDRLELHGFLPHRKTLELQRDSDALLLLLPDIGRRGKDVPSGKLYEYLAAGRPILASVPLDGAAAELVESAQAGLVVPPDDIAAIADALGELHERWRADTLGRGGLSPEWRERLIRKARTRELAALLASL